MKQRTSRLIDRLRHYDSRGVKFYDAKKELLKEGYSDSDIAQALYSFSYDGIPNKPDDNQRLKALFAKHPKETEKVGKYILENLKTQQLQQSNLDNLAARYSIGLHAKARYSLRYADERGFPIFTLLFSLPLIFIAIIRFGLDPIFLYIIPLALIALWYLKELLLRVLSK